MFIGIPVDFAFGSWIQPPLPQGTSQCQTEEMCHVQPHDVWWAEGTQIFEATLNTCKYSGGLIQQFPWSTYSFLITHTSQVTLLTILWLGAFSIERGVTKARYDTDISKLILSFRRSRHRCFWIFHGTVDGSGLWILTKINPIYTLYITTTTDKYLYTFTLHSSWTFALDFWTIHPTHSKMTHQWGL